MRRIKSIIKNAILRVKYFIIHQIPTIFDFILTNNSMKKEIRRNGIKKVKPYSIMNWHFGYKYYTGLLSNEVVFIKFNKNKKWIKHEFDNYQLLKNKNKYLGARIPKIFSFNYVKKGAIIVEQYLEFPSLKECIENKLKINSQKIYEEFETILKEAQKINFTFLDINPSNIYIDKNSKVYIIDLGFSNLNKKNIDFLDNEKLKRIVLNNLNDYSRLDIGVIDDAYSIIQLCKYIEKNFVSKNNVEWLRLNKLMGKSVFDKEELL